MGTCALWKGWMPGRGLERFKGLMGDMMREVSCNPGRGGCALEVLQPNNHKFRIALIFRHGLALIHK